MKDMEKYKSKIISKKNIINIICIIFIIGLIFGSIYITILNNDNKKDIIHSVTNYFNSFSNITIKDKLIIFRDTLIKNLLFFISIWTLGLSIIGLPIIVVMIFFKAFITGFSVSSIFSVYKFKGILGIFLYMVPSNILTLLYSVFLGAYSIDISIKLIKHIFKKKTFNFGLFMGKYFFLLLVSILISVLVSIYEAFINPSLLNLFTKMIK